MNEAIAEGDREMEGNHLTFDKGCQRSEQFPGGANLEVCYVYIVGTIKGEYKIGMASDPWNRYLGFKTGIPSPSCIKLMIRCRDRAEADRVESALQGELLEYHSVGEWYTPPKEVLGALLLDLNEKIMNSEQTSPASAVIEYPLNHVAPDIRDLGE
jgi:hypothetical protein